MVRGCSPECEKSLACDFCRHFVEKRDAPERAAAIGDYDGWCTLHERPANLYYSCNDFHCMNVPEDA